MIMLGCCSHTIQKMIEDLSSQMADQQRDITANLRETVEQQKNSDELRGTVEDVKKTLNEQKRETDHLKQILG